MVETTEHSSIAAPPTQRVRAALLVEDEPLVAMLTEDNLRDLGFEPTWAGSAREGLRAIENDPNLILAVIDVGLPDMRGDDLVLQIRRDRPELGVILATGHDVSELRGRFAGDHRTVILGKPYLAADLAHSAYAVAGD